MVAYLDANKLLHSLTGSDSHGRAAGFGGFDDVTPCLKIKPEIKGFSSSCTCQPFATHGASGKQTWGNGSRALMPSDRYKARVAERVMADVGARRSCCLWQLKQLSLRAKRRVGARPRWWAGLHS